MQPKRILGLALIALACVSVVYVAVRERDSRGDAGVTGEAAFPPEARLAVYFFDQGKDCATCERIPQYALETLDTYFANELASGVLLWRVADVDEPENEHFIEDYGLYTKSIVLVRMRDGAPTSWKNLERLWDLVYDRSAFMAYLRNEIDALLQEAS